MNGSLIIHLQIDFIVDLILHNVLPYWERQPAYGFIAAIISI